MSSSATSTVRVRGVIVCKKKKKTKEKKTYPAPDDRTLRSKRRRVNSIPYRFSRRRTYITCTDKKRIAFAVEIKYNNR